MLLAPHGHLSMIIPADLKSYVEGEAGLAGFSLSKICALIANVKKQIKRYLVEYSKEMVERVDVNENVLESPTGGRSEWYQSITSDFYL